MEDAEDASTELREPFRLLAGDVVLDGSGRQLSEKERFARMREVTRAVHNRNRMQSAALRALRQLDRLDPNT
jgi:regulator of sirC expression with transglutaminase-like and TPR domain